MWRSKCVAVQKIVEGHIEGQRNQMHMIALRPLRRVNSLSVTHPLEGKIPAEVAADEGWASLSRYSATHRTATTRSSQPQFFLVACFITCCLFG